MEVTLGGDRLGSGNQQKQHLHNYEMSSFNLEQDWKSSMAPGVLYPFLKLVGTNHDTFDIDLDSFVRTLPTQGPLFGSFKLQCDVFSVPMRLYNGTLHNNPVSIGLKMNQVYLPKIAIKCVDGEGTKIAQGADKYNSQISNSCLLKYLGFSGIGKWIKPEGGSDKQPLSRNINAIPVLAYYDIFKNYYANKQEANAYVITPEVSAENLATTDTVYVGALSSSNPSAQVALAPIENEGFYAAKQDFLDVAFWQNPSYIVFGGTDQSLDNCQISVGDSAESAPDTWWTLRELMDEGYLIKRDVQADGSRIVMEITNNFIALLGSTLGEFVWASNNANKAVISKIKLTEFPLQNIDTMRERLLSRNTIGSQYVINHDNALLPYLTLCTKELEEISTNAFTMNGLCVKTYQSDLFNNWLDTEIIDGENGVSALSAITIDSNDQFTMDTLNLAQKIYNVLNRIAVAGGTYEDWQEAVYGEGAIRKAETPMYMGGMSAEIMFEEVIANSETVIDGENQPLGTLGGKGTQVGRKGGNNIHIKCEEPSYIIGIVSLTPRICYAQGNDWDLTELNSFDDLHKPGYDGIGFQELITEQMAWWDNHYTQEDGQDVQVRKSAGKQTAWINYQTAVDKAYGDFAASEGKAFMVLSRNYEMDEDFNLGDLTTYIDPSKFNYAFAKTDVAAQNFWVQIHSKIVARRKMAAHQIPNL